MKVGNTPRESEIKNEESWRQDIFNKVTTPRKRLADQTDPNSYIEGKNINRSCYVIEKNILKNFWTSVSSIWIL